MMIKICGLKYEDNIFEIVKLKPYAIGFIFYSKSPRNVDIPFSDVLKKSIQIIPLRTGVFVDYSIEQIINILNDYNLNTVQLHGPYSPKDCDFIKSKGFKVIKAFSIDNQFDWKECIKFEQHVDYYLFDTKGHQPGGNGIAYERSLLNHYKGCTPFLISGGIDLQEALSLKNFKHTMFKGIDINSRFEIKPALKNIDLIKKLFKS